MEKVYLFLLILCCASLAYGQKMEYSIQLNSGLSWYGGESAVKTTQMSGFSYPGDNGSIAKPYGKRPSLAYGASGQIQRVTARQFLYGVHAGVDILRTRAKVDKVWTNYGPPGTAPELHLVSGKFLTQNSLIHVSPYLGQRLHVKTLELDVMLGMDVGTGIGGHEKGWAITQSGEVFRIDRERSTVAIDYRSRLGITAYQGPYGASLSYAHGIQNYLANWDGINSSIYSRVVRVGLHYRL